MRGSPVQVQQTAPMDIDSDILKFQMNIPYDRNKVLEALKIHLRKNGYNEEADLVSSMGKSPEQIAKIKKAIDACT